MSSISNRTMMSGLISGLDTESLVKAMTANTKNRINSQKQKLQTLTWKQESYRDVISKISDFKNKYLDILSSTSIKANSVMKKYSATSSNDKVITASAAAGATAANYTIREASAAKAASVSSSGSISTGEVKLDFSNAVSGREYTVAMTLDGVTKNVTFKAGTNTDVSKENFLKATNAVFAEVKGSGQQFEFTEGTSSLKFNGNDDVFHTFSVGYNSQGVGLANTTSNQIYTNTAINSVGFKQALQETDDGKYEFNINGVDFSISKDAKISDIISEVNNSNAGVKLSFSNVSQSFTLESTTTGSASEINMYQKKGNLLNAMFNVDSGSLNPTQADTAELTYVGKQTATGNVSSVYTDRFAKELDLTNDGPLIANLNVTDKNGNVTNININIGEALKKYVAGADEGGYTDAVVETAINEAFFTAYGSINGTGTDDGIFKYSNGALTIDTQDVIIEFENGFTKGNTALTNAVTLNATPAYVPVEGANTMIFESENGTISINTGASDINLNDLIEAGIISLPSDGNVIAAGNFTAVDDNAKAFFNNLFGKESVIGAKEGDVLTYRGENGMIEVSTDGSTFTKFSSSTNLFTFDGTTINVSNAKDFKAESEEDYITVETAKDNTEIKEVITSFVNDYNQLLSDLYGVTSTSRPKSSGSYYDPLTEEQEEEMSDKEIEKWNENAKTGLLYRDTNVTKFLSEIRSAMLARVDGFGLNDMGISTKDWQSNGKLEIDESKLDTALEAYGDKIADLFTGTDGLAAKLENVVDKAISTSKSKTTDASGKTITKGYGYLSQMAGIEGTRTANDNLIYKQMEYINDIIERLNEKYENEQERYWSKYTRLETMMSKMQSTMSYFSE